jgi:hypothetical protein
MIKTLLHTILLAGIVICAISIPKQSFAADVCWNQRSISEHVCQSDPKKPDTCVLYLSPCEGQGSEYAGNHIMEGTEDSAALAEADCASKCFDPEGSVYPGNCLPAYCVAYNTPTYCQAQDYLAQCTNYVSGGVEYCNAIVAFSSCEGQVSGEACVDTPSQNLTYGCWGPGTDLCGNGTCDIAETCGNCSADCGACPPGTTPTPTTGPTPTTPPTPPPSCTVTGPISVCKDASASYNVTSTNASSTEIWKTVTSSQSWVNIKPKDATTQGTTSISSTGTYYVVSNAIGTGGQ